jgi:cell division protein ZapA
MLESLGIKIDVEISGEKYTMVGDTSPEHMAKIAKYVNEIMKQLSDRNPKLGKTHVAILAALNAADEYFKLKEEYGNIVNMLEPDDNLKRSNKKRNKS